MRRLRLAAGIAILLIAVVVGCGQETLSPRQSAGGTPLAAHPHTVSDSSALCSADVEQGIAGSPHPPLVKSPGQPVGDPHAVNGWIPLITRVGCVLKPGGATKFAFHANIDNDPGDFSIDTCGPASWQADTPDGTLSVVVDTPVTGKTSKDCSRVDPVALTITRAANAPVPSPSPGQLVDTLNVYGAESENTVYGTTYTDQPTIVVQVYEPPNIAVLDKNIAGQIQAITPPNPAPSPIMVGQQVLLQANILGGTAGKITWSFNGDEKGTLVAVGGYNPSQTATVASPSPIAPSSTYGAMFPVYYLLAGSHQIDASAPIQCCGDSNFPVGAPITTKVTAHYAVKAPTAKVTAVSKIPTRVSLDGVNNSDTNDPLFEKCATPPPTGITYYLALNAGNNCIPHAIDWTYKVTNVPPFGAGNISMVQLISSTINGTKNGKAIQTWQRSGLDAHYPYNLTWVPIGTAWTSLDGPFTILENLPCTMFKREDKFADYFMYQAASPQPGNPGRPSIPVTLEKQLWSWGGRTEYKAPKPKASPAWQDPTQTVDPSPAPTTPVDLPSWPIIVNTFDDECESGK